ncbi:cytochrome b5 [Linderina pennispora]|uniref:Cytochrome b5 n=1 Tax=Linderina pennispora TaxID=61395 RepID=A0A1Y1WFL5_9FUNG|nr:cytochrome b5 [Linderina pennispora]ORX72272.1 cytochrome b5 [Linderina pennispora]
MCIGSHSMDTSDYTRTTFPGQPSLYHTYRQVASSSLPRNIPPVRDFTPRELSEFDGRDENTPLYMAVNGTVYDVSNGRSFYGPGGPYANFAGRDASRGLALGSFDKSTLTDLDAPLDDLKGLDKTEVESLNEWATFFAGKYLPVGKLVPNPTAEEKKDN